MEKLLENAITQVPSLVVLAIIVVFFLRHMKERDIVFEVMNKENLEARMHSRAVIERNSEIVGHNSHVCSEMTETMKELTKSIHNLQNGN